MPSFEESLKKLETIVEQLEKGDLALEDSLKLFEEGVGLSAACKQELDAAEGKVQMLVKQRDGSVKPEPFLTDKSSLSSALSIDNSDQSDWRSLCARRFARQVRGATRRCRGLRPVACRRARKGWRLWERQPG